MDVDHFWHLVDSTRGQPDRAEALARLLADHSPDDDETRYLEARVTTWHDADPPHTLVLRSHERPLDG